MQLFRDQAAGPDDHEPDTKPAADDMMEMLSFVNQLLHTAPLEAMPNVHATVTHFRTKTFWQKQRQANPNGTTNCQCGARRRQQQRQILPRPQTALLRLQPWSKSSPRRWPKAPNPRCNDGSLQDHAAFQRIPAHRVGGITALSCSDPAPSLELCASLPLATSRFLTPYSGTDWSHPCGSSIVHHF